MRRRLLLPLLSILVTFPMVVVIAMLLGWRFGPMREVGRHLHIEVRITGSVVDAVTGAPISDASVSDLGMRLPGSDAARREFIESLIAHAGRPEGSIPAVIGTAPVGTEPDGSFVLDTVGWWDLDEPSWGIRLGPDPSPDPFVIVRTLVVEATGYEIRAFSVERHAWTKDKDGFLYELNLGRLELRATR